MKDAVATVLEAACRVTHHVGGCWVLNKRVLLFYNDERDDFRFDLPSPTYRLWRWSMDLP